MRIKISGGRIVDPAAGSDAQGDILIENGRIAAVGQRLDEAADILVQAQGMLVTPGLVDMHVHLRDPGQEYKEDVISGTSAAAAGGVTSLCCMPNTKPAADTPQTVQGILERAKWGRARVYPCAAITRGLLGKELCGFAALKAAGAVAVSDDGRPVEDRDLFVRGVKAAAAAGLRVISHCEDLKIIDNGIIHEGEVSRQLGVRGMDRESEDRSTAREISVARETGLPVHIAHVSTRGAVELIRRAKREGVPVTAETGPHYIALTHEELRARDANFRMNPPLREEADRLAVIEGLRDGTLDAIATDHAPHAPHEKADFLRAPNGVIGLETSFMVSYTLLVRSGIMTPLALLQRMALAPARILGIEAGTLRPGAPADVAVFDIARESAVHAQRMASRSRNTPFEGRSYYGACVLTLCGGKPVYWRTGAGL